MRYLSFIALLFLTWTALAAQTPPGQTRLDGGKILRGAFIQEFQTSKTGSPLVSSGQFTVAPGHGLIWKIEKPFPTSTIITPEAAIQNVGGLSMKLPVKNLRSLYDMVGGALAGDRSALEKEFILMPGGKDSQWQMLLTPRQPGKAKLPYSSITVSGSTFVEKILMTKANGAQDTLSFTETTLSSAPLSASETSAFNKR
ncbi:MAG: LolA-related protein [Alphaproteobacteria bacterium]|nr:LolA-related protein [Alphaproteobacteria bacterium]